FSVANVNAGYDAHGKLEVGDRILAVDDVPILARGKYVAPDGTVYTEGVLRERVNAKKGAPVKITVLRAGQKHDVTITPKLAFVGLPYNVEPTLLMGIAPWPEPDVVKVGVFTAIRDSLEYPIAQTKM